MPIDYFENSKSKTAGCQKCHCYITDKMRGVEETIDFGHKNYHYYCLKCSEEVIKQTKQELFNMEKVLKSQIDKLENKRCNEVKYIAS